MCFQKGVAIEIVSTQLGHKNIAVTQRHYAPWVRSRQISLEEGV
jgi:integrase